jgi:fructokinase
VILDADHTVVRRVRVPTERERGYEWIIGRVGAVVADLLDDAPGCGLVGIGTPGSPSRRTGLLKNSNTICLNGRPLAADLEAQIGIPVRLENDANCFALAESLLGAGRGHELVFGVILGTGVGGGIVVGGKLWSGPQDIAGEWGHHVLDPAGPLCYCGARGCVETMLCGPALEAEHVAAGGPPCDAAAVAVRAAAGDDRAGVVLDRWLDRFGRALANVVNILDPAVVVLGGGLSNVAALYTRGREAVARHVFNDELTTPIVQHALGDSAGVIGAALLTVASDRRRRGT